MNCLSGKILASFGFMFCLVSFSVAQKDFVLHSPDGRIDVTLHPGERFTYDVSFKHTPLLQNAQLSISIDHTTLGVNAKVLSAKERSQDQMLKPVVRQKFAEIRDNFHEIHLELDGGLAVTFRAYNEGVAYRLETSLPQAQVHVYGEEAVFRFARDHTVFYPTEESFFSHNERKYLPQTMSQIASATLATLPAVVDAGDGVKVAIAESDVEEYPGLWLHGTNGDALAATFPPYPLKEQLERDRDFKVVESADYIAVTRGTRTYPWRVIGIAEKDSDLITNQLVWLLEKPSQIQDTSWIKPGKVAWDWWNANNIYGVDFKAGINTQTYKYYIDFASRYGIPYIILDEGWYKLGNLLDVVPDVNIEEIANYGKQKNVGVILWVVWKTLDDQLQPALDQFQKWGVKGIKVDFMQRSDQKLIDYYHKISMETAKRKMLVDFHGDQKPATMTRTWPNLISTEGVRGLEWDKWSAETDPPHDVTLPFTRMFLGPMDFTPGAMLNAQKVSFAPIHDRPMSLGTRCHQLAMYVVFESPLQMLADSPSNYLGEPQMMEFLGPVPSVWDDSKALDGKIGEYVVVARRSGRDWYVGAMTNWSPRAIEIDLSFLPDGKFTMESYEDGVNADRMASDYRQTKTQVSKTTKLTVKMAPGGGWAARIHP
jgi:alpha-glucosidase